MNKVIGIALSILLAGTSVFAQEKEQDWQELMINRSASMQEIQKAFNKAWEGKSYEKGKGYKQFKRWEHFNQSRLWGLESHPPADITWQAIKELGLNNPNSQNRNLGSWTSLGPTSVFTTDNASSTGLGRVNVIAVSPSNPNVIYIGSPAGGIWKSETGGNSWTPLTDHIMSLGVSGIAIDPSNEDIIYIGTGDGDGNDTYSIGILKSMDGGLTWQETGLVWETSQTRTFNKLIIDPVDPSILFAATSSGIYRTVDAGENWTNVQSGSIEDIAFHPTNSHIVYACSDEFLKSTDGGISFDDVDSGLPSVFNVRRYKMGVSLDEPDYVYLVAGDQSNDGFLGLYRSTDAGDSFSLRSNSPNILHWSQSGNGTGGQSWYDLAIAVDPSDANRLFVGGVNVWGSDDGGANWEISSHWVAPNPIGYTHADIHFLSYEGSTIYCGSDGGIYRSNNDGGTWNDLSDGLGITQFYRLGLSETNPDLIIAGSQDNGTFLLENGSWFNVLGADGMEALIYPNNEQRMIGSIQFGFLSHTTNGADSWNSFSDGINENGAWITPYEMDPEENGVVLAGYENIWRNESGSWSQISNFGGGSFNALRIAPSNNEYIYASKNTTLYMTSDGGDNWEIISGSLPNFFIGYIEVDPTDPNIVYTVHSGFSDGEKVYKSIDAGQTWENISENLPNVPINCIELDEGSNGGIYIGTDIGVFYTDNDLFNWTPFMQDLPNVVVSELEIHYATEKIRAATFGRGIWESPLYNGFTDAPTANFDANKTIVCEGETIDFTDLSIGNDGDWEWSFEGGTPASSNDQHPTITYNSPGTYQVSLTIDNPNGSGTEIKTSYIQVIPLQGQETPFEEDFEGISLPNVEWFVVNEDNQTTWQINEGIGNFGPNSAWINNLGNPEDQIDELVSSTIDLSDATDPLLTFYVAYAETNPNNDDRLRVFVSKDCGETWSLRKTLTSGGLLMSAPETINFFEPNEDQWNYVEITNILETFFVENFRVKFTWQSGGGNNIYLDDINLSGTVSNNDIAIESIHLSLYPNPSNGNSILNFSLKEEAETLVYLTDITGRRVMDIFNSRSTSGDQVIEVNTEQLTTGTYFVVLNINGQEFTQKLLRE